MRFTWLGFILFSSLWLLGQENIAVAKYQSFNTINGLGTSSIRSVGIDSQGLLYIVATNSIQKFDGSLFLDFEVPKLNFSTFSKIHFSKENQLYIFDRGKMHRFQKNGNKSSLVSLNLHTDEVYTLKILNENDDEFWALDINGQFIIINKKSFKITFQENNKLLDYKDIIEHISPQNSIDEIYFSRKNDIVKINKKGDKVKFSILNSFYKNIRSFLKVSDNKYLFISGNKLYLGPIGSRESKLIGTLGNADQSLRTTIIPLKDNEYIVTFDNTLYMYNGDLKTLTKVVKDNEQKSFFKNGPINSTSVDKYQNIYLFSLAEGFVKIAKPSKVIQSIVDVQKPDFITALYYDPTEEILITGSLRSGLKIYDRNKNIIFDYDKPITPIVIWKNKANEYIFRNMVEKEYSTIKKNNGSYEITKVNKSKHAGSFYMNIMHETNEKILFNNGPQIGFIDKNIKFGAKYDIEQNLDSLKNYYLTGILNGNIYYIGGYEEVTLLDSNFKLLKKYKIKDAFMIRKILKKNESEFYIGSDRGLELYSNEMKLIKQYYKGQVYSIVATNDGRIWCGTNKGIICLTNESIIQFNSGDGLTCDEYNTSCALYTNNGKLIFGGIGGIDIFDEEILLNLDKQPDCTLSEIMVNDEKILEKYYIGDVLTLPYNKSLLNFKIAPLGSGNINSYIVQYRIVGLNDQWTNGLQSRSISYQLQPGTYEFQYTAGKYFDPNPSKYKSIKIKIKPVFYKTWWFITLSLVALIALLYYILSLINRIKFEKQEAAHQVQVNLLNQRSQFTKELHDLIGSQLGIVSRNIDYILEDAKNMPEEKVQEMLTQTVGLSKQIAKDVRDTIWASNKETITIEEFVMRIKDHTYFYKYLPMEIKVEGQIEDAKLLLQPNEGLNLLRIVQEALHNAEKHSKATVLNIIISSKDSVQIDIFDNGVGLSDKNIKSNGNGLENMKSRAYKINYSFELVPVSQGVHIKLKKNGTI